MASTKQPSSFRSESRPSAAATQWIASSLKDPPGDPGGSGDGLDARDREVVSPTGNDMVSR
jgi:hypothetical protein